MMRRTRSVAVLLTLVVLCLAVIVGFAWGEEASPAGEPQTSQTAPASAQEEAPPPVAEEPPAAPAAPEPAGPPPAVAETPPPAPESTGEVGQPTAVEQGAVPPPIVDVRIEGNVTVSSQEILDRVSSKVGGQYSDPQVKRDVEAIRQMGWFARVWQDSESEENGIRLTFHVVENPVITDIQFQGNRELTREQLLAVMKTKPGQIYNARDLLADAGLDGNIERLYQKEGYTLAMVLPPSMSDTGVLTIPIAEGVIEEIRITGNTHTKNYAIRRYIRTKVGESYDEHKVQRDVGRLNSLGWFETVRRDADVGSEPGKVILIFTVVEKKRSGLASVGGGYSSVQGLVGFIDLTKTNVGGNGQEVSIRGEFGGRTSYELGYQNPWVMTPETRLSAGIYDRLILREAFVLDDEGNSHDIFYDERRNGGNVTLGRPLSDTTTVFFGLRADDVSISDVDEDELPFLTDENGQLLPAFQPRDVRSITLAGVNDTRNDLFNPSSGFYQRLSAEFAGVLGGVDFNKYVSDSRRFFPIGKKVLAFRLLGGAVTGDAPYLEQFLIGGTESLRGFRTDRFVGTRMAILNTELRFPVSENLLGVAFVDVGDAWGGPVASDPAFGDVVHDSFQAHVGYGVGVRVRTPIGPLRLDLGFSEEGTETHFGVRHMF
ncbi:MAG: outer membrane protein assembly factor [Armatimonadota bacterium]